MLLKNPPKISPNLIKQLETILGKDGVIRRKDELLTYECDGITGYRQRPALVVLPRSTAEIATVVKLCHDNEIAWVARGASWASSIFLNSAATLVSKRLQTNFKTAGLGVVSP